MAEQISRNKDGFFVKKDKEEEDRRRDDRRREDRRREDGRRGEDRRDDDGRRGESRSKSQGRRDDDTRSAERSHDEPSVRRTATGRVLPARNIDKRSLESSAENSPRTIREPTRTKLDVRASERPAPREHREERLKNPDSRSSERPSPRNTESRSNERPSIRKADFDSMLNDLDGLAVSPATSPRPSPRLDSDKIFRPKPDSDHLEKPQTRKLPIRSITTKRQEAPPAPVEKDFVSLGRPSQKELDQLDTIEQQRSRMEKQRVEQEKKEQQRKEAEMVASEREKQTKRRSVSIDFALLDHRSANESILVDDYVEALMSQLRSDKTISPLPEDFADKSGYAEWRSSITVGSQDMVAKMLKYRFLVRKTATKQEATTTKVRFKIVSCRDLISKEKATFCKIEHGNLAIRDKKRPMFETEVVKGTNNPKWNQHLKLECTDISEQVRVQVWDTGNHFLGQVVLSMSTIITQSVRNDNKYSKWHAIDHRDVSKKDRYVGGDILIEAQIEQDNEKQKKDKSYENIQNQISEFGLDNRALFKVLMRACVSLDLQMPKEGRGEIMTEESVAMLKVWSRFWTISEAAQMTTYLDIIFGSFKQDMVPVDEVSRAFHILFAQVKQKNWISQIDHQPILKSLEDVQGFLRERVSKYKEIFPKGKPSGALEDTILILRMVHRFPIFKEYHPELPESFREELRIVMTDSCIQQFQKFKEISAPLDETDVGSVIEGISKLAELVSDEIETDAKYFQKAFAQELDIVRLTAEIHLKYFILSLEDTGDILESERAVTDAPGTVFEFYNRVKKMNARYAKLVPTLRSNTTGAGFNIETWFSPFLYKWLNQLSNKTAEWVDSAIKQDQFSPPQGELTHSTSITDIFSAIYSELDFITKLEWSNTEQNCVFLTMFSKTMNVALEKYCDSILANDSTKTLFTQATSLLSGRQKGPSDINPQSCVKLRNMAFASKKLKELYRLMNASALKKKKKTKPSAEGISGAFKVIVEYAENIKAMNKNGLSNPYVVIRVPEGTVVPIDEELENVPAKDDSKPVKEILPTVLNGSACEIVKTRAIADTVNAKYSETHQVMVPPVNRLEVACFSKNLLTADEITGTAIIDLTAGSRLLRKLQDNQTHDVFVELEPQGRILLTMTLEGEQEDADFWFRRTNERLLRARNEFLRMLTENITPYIKQVIQKAIKDNEAAVIPAKGFFSALTSTVEYSNETPQGISVDQKVNSKEVGAALNSLAEYLDKNLETLSGQLNTEMCQDVIESTWDETLTFVENILLPALYGVIDSNRRLLNPRQVSMINASLTTLLEFFHADGLGLSIKRMEGERYKMIKQVIQNYFEDTTRLSREYELSLMGGQDKEWLLRLVRIKSEKNQNSHKEWFEKQLSKRKELQRR